MSPSAQARHVDIGPVIPPTQPARAAFHRLEGSPVRKYFLYAPKHATPSSPIVVLVHGISRNAAEHLFRFMPEADRIGAVLVAPLFLRETYGQYQQVIDPKRRTRADLALLDIIDDVARRTGTTTNRIHLFGFSGGAQFAHRFAMMHPQRVASAVCCAAGWYTFPLPEQPYPLGIATHPVAGGSFDVAAFSRVPIHVVVGSRDVARDKSVRVSDALDDQQGSTRLERARRWFSSLEKAAARVGTADPGRSISIIPRAGHSFTEAAGRRGLTGIVFEKFGLTPTAILRKSKP